MDERDEREGRIREPLGDERGSTVARVIAVAALVAAVALIALAMFGGGSSYTVHAVFDNAGQLVRGNEVRVGGQPIGSITDIDLNDEANAVVTMGAEIGANSQVAANAVVRAGEHPDSVLLAGAPAEVVKQLDDD